MTPAGDSRSDEIAPFLALSASGDKIGAPEFGSSISALPVSQVMTKTHTVQHGNQPSDKSSEQKLENLQRMCYGVLNPMPHGASKSQGQKYDFLQQGLAESLKPLLWNPVLGVNPPTQGYRVQGENMKKLFVIEISVTDNGSDEMSVGAFSSDQGSNAAETSLASIVRNLTQSGEIPGQWMPPGINLKNTQPFET